LRIEWAKTRAKALQYAEEVDLLEEEMRRVLQFLEWRASWWRAQIGVRAEGQSEELREGHVVYVHTQAAYMEGLRTKFQTQWKDVPTLLAGARKAYSAMLPNGGEVEGDNESEDEEGDGKEEREAEDAGAGRSSWLSD
jgi:hypothetical protein